MADGFGIRDAGQNVLRRSLRAEVRIVDDAGERQAAGRFDLAQDLHGILCRARQRPRAVHDQQHLVIAFLPDLRCVPAEGQRPAVVAADVENAVLRAAADERVGLLRHGRHVEVGICKRRTDEADALGG